MMSNGVQERSVGLKKWDDEDQSYEGEFFGDTLHGQGTYRWNKSEVYEGGFFSNQKEGYAVLSFSNNSSFEGLFIKNRPFGPGILTHSNGRQDAGFWVGEKLVRLSRPVDFIVPRLAPTSAAKIKLLQFRHLITLNEKDNSSASSILKKCGCSPNHQFLPYSNAIHDPRSIFFNHLAFEKTFFIRANNLFENLFEGRYLNKSEDFLRSNTPEYVNKESWEKNSESGPNTNCLCPGTFAMEYRDKEDSLDICSESRGSTNNQLGLLAYYSKYGTFEEDESRGKADIDFEEEEEDEEDEKTSSPIQIVSWNRSELCTEMLKQIFRHRTFEEKLNFKIAKLMLGVRTEFRRTGEKEKECLLFLKMCSLGPVHVVKDLLCRYELSAELMDSRGNASLMFAAAADQHEIIDLLLDYGVDVNTFNDEGLTPLNLCLLRRLAQANRICNWETAFLPTEIQRVPENNLNTEVWKDEESIESLDRIFGDGMSADSKAGISQTLGLNGDTNEMEEEQETNTSVSGHQTKVMKAEFVPKSIRRDEFEQSEGFSTQDRYIFDLSPGPQSVEVDKKMDSSRLRNRKIPRDADDIEEEEDEGEYERKESDVALVEKLRQIDKTIEILLSRGADPNISEVPKPSIHLGVFTKDVNVVNTLLHYGANPDCQLYSNEGLLTPLHVVALLKPALENVEICRVLLDHGANLEEETSPEFCIHEAEKEFLDDLQGRTPLQVLCMRPDLEYADPKGYVTQIGLMLAKYSDKNHFYKGHSFITLAMLTGNIKLLRAFLESNYYDPNDLLGDDLGTALHVLVSTQFQKKTSYENSIKVCDLLLSAKADPLKEYKTPSELTGTCIDYGYREIDEEKATRKVNGSSKKETKGGSNKQEKGKVRDHLKDHIKVVEYLEAKASDLRKASIPTESYLDKGKVQRGSENFTKLGNEERRKNQTGKQKDEKESETTVLNENGNPEKLRKTEYKNFHQNDNTPKIKGGNKSKNFEQTGKQGRQNEHIAFNNDEYIEKAEGKNEYQSSDETRNPEEPRKESESKSFNFKGSRRSSKGDNEPRNFDQKERRRRGSKLKSFDESKDLGSLKRQNQFESFNKKGNSWESREEDDQNHPKKRGKGSMESDKSLHQSKNLGNSKRKAKSKNYDGKEYPIQKENSKRFEKDKKLERETRNIKDNGRNFDSDFSSRDPLKRIYVGKTGKKTFDDKMGGEKDGRQHIKPKLDKQTSKSHKNSKSEISGVIKRESSLEGQKRMLRVFKSFSLSKYLSYRERFPEKLRQTILQVFGNCVTIDVDKLLLPYVVLRNGDLYYMFEGRFPHKTEQYSLI